MGDVRCPRCQTDNPSDSKFCKECTTPLPSTKAISASPTDTLQTAIREVNQALSICPVSKDALAGPTYVSDLARIYVSVGDYESAIDQLDYLMSIPAGGVVSLASLKNDPSWDPLRDHPRFKQLVEKYSKPS